MEEKNDGKNSIYDLVLEQVEDDAVDSMCRTDAIFTVIYKWLDKALAEEGYEGDAYLRTFIVTKFEPYVP
jgi:hypothetical protein